MKYSSRILVALIALLAAGSGSFCSLARDAGGVRMLIHSMQADVNSAEIAIVLTDEKREKFLPISIGGEQALSIQLGREGRVAKRPLTHDLIANIFKTLKVSIERVTITDLRQGVYYAEVILQQNGQTHRIDARPSDAIALSLRAEAPIYAMPHLLQDIDKAAIEEVPGQTAVEEWGITVQSLTEALASFFNRKEGVLVSDVAEDSPAAKSGLRAGDILIRAGNKKLRNVEDFLSWQAEKKEDKSAEVEVIRGNQTLTLTLTK
jgi:hypothetical protein